MNSEQREKYSRQILFAGIGEEGQEQLLRAPRCSSDAARWARWRRICWCAPAWAACGSSTAISWKPSNLQRQTLFEESDAREALPKAVAAERRLRAINSDVAVEGIVADLTPRNAAELLSGFDANSRRHRQFRNAPAC